MLTVTSGSLSYYVNENSNPTAGIYVDPDFIILGTQRWARFNLNVGSMIASGTGQTNNSTLEKYCPDNLESGCTASGALYQWDEAMQYATAEGSRGICPVGSHIPTDNELKILEVYLGMTQLQADSTGFRGTDQRTKMKAGGSTGLNVPLPGYRDTSGTITFTSLYARLWSSSESGASAWYRRLETSDANILRNVGDKFLGYSVRCIAD